MEYIIQTSGLYAYHGKEPGEKGKTRTENLEELISATKNFEQSVADSKKNIENHIFLMVICGRHGILSRLRTKKRRKKKISGIPPCILTCFCCFY